MVSDFVQATTYSGWRLHLARVEDMKSDRVGPGRYGRALCDNRIRSTVYDQEAFDADRRRWNPGYVPKPIAALPACVQCRHSATRAGA